MVFDLIIKPIVFVDTEEAVIFYSKYSKETAERFYSGFLKSLQELKLNPHHYAYISKPVRRHIFKDFPIKYFMLLKNTKSLL